MGIAGRLNGILHFIENPCNEPWVVYVNAAEPWADKAAMAFLGLDVMQTVRTALSPGELRSHRHMRRGKNAEHISEDKLPGFPDPYEYLGHIVKKPILDFIKANATWGTRAIWVITNKLEEALWQYMLFDMATDFLYHSLADARKSKYCARWSKGDWMRSGPGIFQIAAGWVAMDVVTLHYGIYPISGGFYSAFLANTWDGSITMVASLSGIAVDGAGTQLHGFRIINVGTGEVLAQIGPQPYATFQPVEFVLEGTLKGWDEIGVQYYQELGHLAYEGIIMCYAGGQPKAPPKPPKKKTSWKPRPPKKPKRPKTGVYRTAGGGKIYRVPELLAYRKRKKEE